MRIKHRKITEHQVSQMLQLYAFGQSITAIAAEVGCGYTAVRDTLLDRGVKLRPRWRPARAPRVSVAVGPGVHRRLSLASSATGMTMAQILHAAVSRHLDSLGIDRVDELRAEEDTRRRVERRKMAKVELASEAMRRGF